MTTTAHGRRDWLTACVPFGEVTGGVEYMITVELITGMVITVGSVVTLLMAILIVQIYRSDKGPRENGSH